MATGKSAFDLPGIWTYLKNLKIEVRCFFPLMGRGTKELETS